MRRTEKILVAAILCVLGWWGVCYAADTKISALPAVAIGNDDQLVAVVNDPNGVAATSKIGVEELLAYWTGSTAITTLGTIGTGTWNASFTDAALTAIDAGTWTGAASITTVGTVTTGSINKIAADESSDATLTALGQVHIRGDEDRISTHAGAGGEIAGEVTMSFLKHLIVPHIDPGAYYDTTDEFFLMTVNSKVYPNGIIIDYWRVSCKLDPDVEMTMNLGYSDTDFDMADDPNVVDVLDTTNGVSSEDTDANINGGAAIAAGKVLFLYWGADPEGTCVDLTFEMIFHAEED